MTETTTNATKVRIGDMQMAITDQGQGTPVLLLHGYPLNRTMWADQVEGLSRDFRVIAPDLRGHGESDAPAGTYSMSQLADDLRGLLDRLEISRVVLLGFSMGGYGALAFHEKYADHLSGFVFADTRAGADSAEAKQGREDAVAKILKEGNRWCCGGAAPALARAGHDSEPTRRGGASQGDDGFDCTLGLHR